MYEPIPDDLRVTDDDLKVHEEYDPTASALPYWVTLAGLAATLVAVGFLAWVLG